MKKKLLLLLTTLTSVLSIITGLLLSTNKTDSLKAKNETYGLIMNSSNNKFHNNTGLTSYSGESVVRTNLGNEIGFSYIDLMGLSSTWHIAKNGGGFYNTTPIHGLESIKLSFKTDAKDFKLYWSGNQSFSDANSETLTSSTSTSAFFEFNGDCPSFFKFENISGSNLNISEVELEFSCQNYYPTLTIRSDNTSMGSVSGDNGAVHAGDNLTIKASPFSGYSFTGWYCDDVLISTSKQYSFVMGYEDIEYIAHFTINTYTLTVQSESLDKGSVNDISGVYDYGSQVTIEATANEGHSFTGWYVGNTLKSTENPYTFSMPASNSTFTAHFSKNSYTLTLINQNPDLGRLNYSSPKQYSFGDSVNIKAFAYNHVSFLGWFDMNDNLVSTRINYFFTMPSCDVTYTGKFIWTPYLVDIQINDNSLGTVEGAASYIYDQEVCLVAIPNEHCSFFGWYKNEALVSRDSTYVFNMPGESLSFEAVFVENHSLYVYSEDESKGTVSFPSEWGEGLEVTVIASGIDNYAFDCWYDEDLNDLSNESSYTFVMPDHDITLFATFDLGYQLTVLSTDNSKGTVSGGGVYMSGREVTASMQYISGTFLGWYSNNTLLSNDNPYTFIMPSKNYTVTAKFRTDQEEWNIAHGVTPFISEDGKTLSYGLYPQDRVDDSELIADLEEIETTESNGWYLHDGEYYAKYKTGYISNAKFNDGLSVSSNETYWFICKPIIWKILSGSSGEYFLLSSVLLDQYVYADTSSQTIDGHYANNYEFSDIRSWLNSGFLNSAFGLENKYIQTTLVDNSAKTTEQVSDNPYCCNNTNDKIFLLSYQDYCNSSYGFNSWYPSTRYCLPTDWSIAKGVSYSNDSGLYWTRSPLDTLPRRVMAVATDGEINNSPSVNATNVGVRPGLKIRIS